MVQQGDFTLELVEAETKVPYKEHHKEGKTYVEVEPNAEYFICINRVGNSKYKSKPLKVKFFVDEKLKSDRPRYAGGKIENKPRFYGGSQRKNGIWSKKALKFSLAPIGFSNTADTEPTLGSIQAKIFSVKKIVARTPRSQPADYQEEKNDPRKFLVKPGDNFSKAKFVRSTSGSTEIEVGKSFASTYGITGELLETITLYYCTVPGLVHVGLLPKPPKRSVEEYLLFNPHKKNPLPKLQAKRIKVLKTMIKDDKQLASEEQECDLFDLTNLPSDCSDSEDGPEYPNLTSDTAM